MSMNTKHRIILTVFLTIFIIACKPKVDKVDTILKTGWYYVSEQKTEFEKQLDKSSEFYFINPDLIIPVEHFAEIEITENEHDGVQYPVLVIRFDQKGTDNWSLATKKATDSKLALIINNKLVNVPKVNVQITSGISSLSRIEYTKQDLENFVEQIEGEQKFNGKIIFAPEQTIAIELPEPQMDGTVSVEKALNNRRSHRQFRDKEISVENLSQILWAAYGITLPNDDYAFLRGGFRTAPSAGGLYPLDIYVVIGKVKGVESGVYKYFAKGHKISKFINEDIRAELCAAALGQKMVAEAPVSIIYTAIFSRTTNKYGTRGSERYVCMDLGHSAENVYLQVETLGLGTCAIGAFIDDEVAKILRLPNEEEPLYIMPIGYYDK